MTRHAGLVFVMVAALTACLDVAGPPARAGATGPNGFTGIEETEDGLALLTTPCSFVDAGTMTIALAAGEYALVGLSSSGDLRVNGKPCGAATAASTKKINITGSADGGDETVVLDYLRGGFVPGISTSAGVVIDLKGGTGDVLKLRGSSGNDTVVLGTSTTGVGAAGTFAISLAFDGGTPDGYKDLTITNTETVVVSTGPGADVVSGAGVSYGTGSLAFGAVTSGTSPRLVVYGGEGADALTGGNGDDTLWGGAGDDTLFEGSTANGADTLSGGSEADGGPGLDTVRYESRTSSLTLVLGGGAVSGAMLADGGFERDALEASLEVVNGGSGNDVMSCAGEAACTLHGNGGNDVLTGGSLADTLWGEAGNDTIVPGLGDDVVDCGAGTADVVSYADRGASASLDVTLGAGGAAQSGSGEASEDDSIAACEHIVGGAGDDVLTGNELDNRLTGGAGDDVLWGLAGNDTFDEGAGPNGGDTFHGGDGEDLVDYSARTGALSCDLSDDTANDGEGSEADDLKLDVEDVTGGSGGSTIIGSSSDNKIDPGSGTNTVTCGDGFDILIPNGSTTNAASDCEAASAPLVSIVVTPANPTSIKSSTRLFTATGRYSDSTTQNLTASPTLTWASSNTSVAIISNAAGSRGLSSTIAPGSTIISATVGAVTGTTSFTVLAASLTSITVTPNNVSVALGFTRTFLAIGGYSDGSTQDLSSQVTWTSSVEAVAIISNATGSQGLTSSLSVGTTSIGAVLGAVSGTSSLTVTGPTLVGPIVVTPSSPSLSVSGTQQLTASADYSDGSTQDITASVTWASSAPAVATVSSEGLATGVSAGAATVTATLGGLSGSTTVTVTP